MEMLAEVAAAGFRFDLGEFLVSFILVSTAFRHLVLGVCLRPSTFGTELEHHIPCAKAA